MTIASKFFLTAFLRRYMRQEKGATAIEYCLIVVGIALAIFTAVGIFGETLVGVYGEMDGAAQSAIDSAP